MAQTAFFDVDTEMTWYRVEDFTPPKTKPKYCRAVYQLDMDGNTVRRYNSVSDAARRMRCCDNNIHQVLKGRTPTACGYKWAYADDLEKQLPDA